MPKNKGYTLQGLMKTIGPGILYAGAAIGASHLVQSTRAGAAYGFELVWIVILINVFKYPFFEFGYRYTAATGKSLLEGYRELGRWAIVIFFVLNFFSSIVNFAAVTIVMAGLANHFFGLGISTVAVSGIMLFIVLLLLFVGRYALLDSLMKLLIVVLSILTVLTFIIALGTTRQISPDFLHPDIWEPVGIAFLLALMGWMPTPIEASAWPSLWAIEKAKQTKYRPTFKEAMIDFHIGYGGSAIMALFFLGLGALAMYGSGEEFASSTVAFSKQIVELYSMTLGDWSRPIIGAIALITIFSTALTVIDGYPRALEGSIKQIFPSARINHLFYRNQPVQFWIWALFLSFGAVLIIGLFSSDIKSLVDFATILSFLAAPFFALINYRVVMDKTFPARYKPQLWLRLLSISGIIFLVGFGLVFLYSRL